MAAGRISIANTRRSPFDDICFGVGSLAICSRTSSSAGPYRGEVHRGGEAILDRGLSGAAGQTRRNAVARQVRLGALPPFDRPPFDDRGNRMDPTHANKLGVRYRYYVSQAILGRKVEAGSIARVRPPESGPCAKGLRRCVPDP
jgi:hypothetical protein